MIAARVSMLLSSPRTIPLVVAFAVLLRLLGDLVVGADVPQYEFGIIAQNLTGGRGFSYFSADSAGRVHISSTGTPLPSAFMPPLYTLLVAVADALTTSAEAATRVIQVVNLLLAAVLVAMFARLLRLLCNARVAVIGAAFVACYPPLAYSSTQVSASNAYIPLELSLLFALARLSTRVSWSRVLTVGLLLGLLTWLRSEAVILLPLVAIWCSRYGAASNRRRGLAIGAGVLVVSLVLPLAWMARNSAVLDRPTTSITTTAGFNFWIGNHPDASGSQKQVTLQTPPERAEDPLRAQLDKLKVSNSYESERDRVYVRAATSYVKSHPGETALRDLKKFAMLLVGDVYDPRSNVLIVAANVVLLVGGVWGLGRTRMPRHYQLLLAGYVTVSALVATVFFTLERYALPLRLVLAIFLAERLGVIISRTQDVHAASQEKDLTRSHRAARRGKGESEL